MRMRTRRLLVRVYLFGLMLLLCVGAAQLAVGRILSGPSNRPGLHHHIGWIVDKALPAGASAATLHDEMWLLQRELGIQISLYDASGKLLDGTVNPALTPLNHEEIERLRGVRWLPLRKRMTTAIGRFSGDQLIGYALAAPRRLEPPPGRMITAMLLTLLVVAMASVPFARSLTKPLERLAATVRRLGEGDLRVRAVERRKDEVGDLSSAFNEMAERIEQLRRAEKELLANVSHELRTPLARIRVALDLAASGRPLRYLPEIAEDLAELERMVDDILTAMRLDLSQERAGVATTPLRLQPTDPRQLLARAVSRFSDHHPDRELLVEVPERLPILQTDPTMLRRVIDNLLENAHKYSNADRVIELQAHAAPAAGPQSSVEIAVRDQGIGIDAADLPRVFTPFFRSDRSRARQTGGVGLGLPLARRIVLAHGGDIEVRSEVGIGTTITVRLPIR